MCGGQYWLVAVLIHVIITLLFSHTWFSCLDQCQVAPVIGGDRFIAPCTAHSHQVFWLPTNDRLRSLQNSSDEKFIVDNFSNFLWLAPLQLHQSKLSVGARLCCGVVSGTPPCYLKLVPASCLPPIKHKTSFQHHLQIIPRGNSARY